MAAGMAMSGFIKEQIGYMGNFSLGITCALLAMFYAIIFLKVFDIVQIIYYNDSDNMFL
jgi:hypothetical protein